jgi:hypothetical protein
MSPGSLCEPTMVEVAGFQDSNNRIVTQAGLSEFLDLGEDSPPYICCDRRSASRTIVLMELYHGVIMEEYAFIC